MPGTASRSQQPWPRDLVTYRLSTCFTFFFPLFRRIYVQNSTELRTRISLFRLNSPDLEIWWHIDFQHVSLFYLFIYFFFFCFIQKHISSKLYGITNPHFNFQLDSPDLEIWWHIGFQHVSLILLHLFISSSKGTF